MKNKKLYALLAWVTVLMLIGGLSVNGKALSTNASSTQTNRHLPSSLLSNVSQSPLAYSGYTRVTDNEDKITLQVPVEWNDIETGEWMYKGRNVGVYVAASGDLGNFYATRSQPGVLIGVSHSLAKIYGKDGMLGLEKRDLSGQCTYKGRFDFQNQFYAVQYDHYTNCAAGTPNLLVLTTTSADKKTLIFLRIVTVSEADLEAVDKILSSFQVLGDPEVDEHHQ